MNKQGITPCRPSAFRTGCDPIVRNRFMNWSDLIAWFLLGILAAVVAIILFYGLGL